MTNIYLMDSEEGGFVDFVEDHEDLHDKTNEHFKKKNKEGVSLGAVRQQ